MPNLQTNKRCKRIAKTFVSPLLRLAFVLMLSCRGKETNNKVFVLGLAMMHKHNARRPNGSFSSSQSSSSRRRQLTTQLPTPRILYQSNHLLAVDKPPGWQSVLNQEAGHAKCLMQYLQSQKLGGGSQGDFLKPIHRLDQPCSGVLLYAKTTKAASRIQSQWNAKVDKTYHVVVVAKNNNNNKNKNDPVSLSSSLSPQTLRADMEKRKFNQRSVHMTANPAAGQYEITCHVVASHPPYTLLQVKTKQGARHMIRAILAAYGYPLAGDLRYSPNGGSSSSSSAAAALPDRSVALHCSRLVVDISLGSESSFDICAPLPATWKTYFGFSTRSLSSSSSLSRNKN